MGGEYRYFGQQIILQQSGAMKGNILNEQCTPCTEDHGAGVKSTGLLAWSPHLPLATDKLINLSVPASQSLGLLQ